MPHNEDSECVVLGTIMSDRGALDQVREILAPQYFYNTFHAEVYRAILDTDAAGDRPDIITVKERLTRNGVRFEITDFMRLASCYTYDLYQHAAIVHDKAKRRQFYEIGSYLISNCFDETTDLQDVLAEAKDKLDHVLTASSLNVATLADALGNVRQQIERNRNGENMLTGTPTGFSAFDSRSGGLQHSDLVVIAADTSQGKTSLAIKMAMNANTPIAFYSLEMKKEQIAARMLSIESGIPANELQFVRMPDNLMQNIDSSITRLADRPIYFDDRSTSNIDTILTSIRTMKVRYGIDGAIVDYLQILTVNRREANKEQQMAEAARRLKNLAKELDIWIIALSQLNRETQGTIPTLARLRDSGQIAEAADTVMLIYRPEVYDKCYPQPFAGTSTDGTAMIDVAKGRNIGTFRFITGFNKPTTDFYELDDIPLPADKRKPGMRRLQF